MLSDFRYATVLSSYKRSVRHPVPVTRRFYGRRSVESYAPFGSQNARVYLTSIAVPYASNVFF